MLFRASGSNRGTMVPCILDPAAVLQAQKADEHFSMDLQNSRGELLNTALPHRFRERSVRGMKSFDIGLDCEQHAEEVSGTRTYLPCIA